MFCNGKTNRPNEKGLLISKSRQTNRTRYYCLAVIASVNWGSWQMVKGRVSMQTQLVFVWLSTKVSRSLAECQAPIINTYSPNCMRKEIEFLLQTLEAISKSYNNIQTSLACVTAASPWHRLDIMRTKEHATSFPGSSLYLEVERGPWERGWRTRVEKWRRRVHFVFTAPPPSRCESTTLMHRAPPSLTLSFTT